VGAVDGGWGVAMTTLMFERVAIGLGGEGFGWRADRFAAALLEDEATARDPEFRHRFGEIASEFLALRYTGYRMLTALQRGQIPGPEGALAKVTTIRGAIAAGELLCDALGPAALADDHWGELVSDLPGLKTAGGTEEILRSMVGERVLGLPPEPRLDKGVPFSELRARERAAQGRAAATRGGGVVNFALSDEQEFLKEAARGTLGRFATVAAAREALDGGELPDLWPAACEAGWPGLLIAEQHGGAGLSALEAMLVFAELGRCWRPCRCSGTCRPRTCSTPPATTAWPGWRPARRAPPTCRSSRRATSRRSGPPTRASVTCAGRPRCWRPTGP
jgi:alkylation response protein AidB-like acyl-CoA dehydrogenase